MVLWVGEWEGRETESPGSQVAPAGGQRLDETRWDLLQGTCSQDVFPVMIWSTQHGGASTLSSLSCGLRLRGWGRGADGSPPRSAQAPTGDPCKVPTLGPSICRGGWHLERSLGNSEHSNELTSPPSPPHTLRFDSTQTSLLLRGKGRGWQVKSVFASQLSPGCQQLQARGCKRSQRCSRGLGSASRERTD